MPDGKRPPPRRQSSKQSVRAPSQRRGTTASLVGLSVPPVFENVTMDNRALFRAAVRERTADGVALVGDALTALRKTAARGCFPGTLPYGRQEKAGIFASREIRCARRLIVR